MILRRSVAVYSESGVLTSKALADLIEQAQVLDMDSVLKDIEEYPKVPGS